MMRPMYCTRRFLKVIGAVRNSVSRSGQSKPSPINELVPTIARIVRKKTLGFGHLVTAEREDLLLETLILDERKPYHRFFTAKTLDAARDRMREYGFLKD